MRIRAFFRGLYVILWLLSCSFCGLNCTLTFPYMRSMTWKQQDINMTAWTILPRNTSYSTDYSRSIVAYNSRFVAYSGYYDYAYNSTFGKHLLEFSSSHQNARRTFQPWNFKNLRERYQPPRTIEDAAHCHKWEFLLGECTDIVSPSSVCYEKMLTTSHITSGIVRGGVGTMPFWDAGELIFTCSQPTWVDLYDSDTKLL